MALEMSLSDKLAVGGIVLTIILLVLDKASKLKGPMLLVLLGVAALMALPLALGNSWAVGATSGMLKFSRSALLVCGVGLIYSLIAIWISPEPAKTPRPTSHQDTVGIGDRVAAKVTPAPSIKVDVTRSGLPEGPDNHYRPEVVMIFKASPLFTEPRKERITKIVDDYRHYLMRVGFEIPKEVPPLGTAKGLGMSGGSEGGGVFNADMVIPERPSTLRRILWCLLTDFIYSEGCFH